MEKILAKAARKHAEPTGTAMENVMALWASNSKRGMQELMSPGRFSMTSEHIDVPHVVQKWNSGTRCAMLSHYDTILYAFTNPWSGWKVKPVEFGAEKSGEKCKKYRGSRPSPGCNID